MVSETIDRIKIPTQIFNGLRLVDNNKPDVARYWRMRARVLKGFYAAMFKDPYKYIPVNFIISRTKEIFDAETNEVKAQLYYLEESDLSFAV
ncbi:hypothetical protein DRP05_10585 [Archaeoglobales archaeon]|nr:MAG: hypothetical protein DRO97_11225 [Archaeoglobales archaeon]RLI77294.1 MAG: hypothetical protein DRP05_10585 [Archaeoglobales archaeon]